MANKDLKGYRLTIYSRYYEGSEWLIDHSIQEESILFFAANTEWQTILPQEVEQVSTGILRVTFPISVSGYGSVFRFTPVLGGKTQTISTPTDSVSFEHGFIDQNFILQAWDTDGKLVLPKEIKKFEKTCTVDFHENFSGNLYMARTLGQQTDFETAVEWIYKAGISEAQGHMFIQVCDESDEVILPGEEQKTTNNPSRATENQVKLTFSDLSVEGKVLPIIHGYRI